MDVVFPNRRLRICVWNPTPQIVGPSLGLIESELSRLGTAQLVKLKTLEDEQLLPCDLMVITASYVDEEHFIAWLKGLEGRLARQGTIKIPAIIWASVPTHQQRDILRWAVESNWYFDIIDPDHSSSLPIRVANFLRLHDHLHEVKRMNEVMTELSERVQTLEASLAQTLDIKS